MTIPFEIRVAAGFCVVLLFRFGSGPLEIVEGMALFFIGYASLAMFEFFVWARNEKFGRGT